MMKQMCPANTAKLVTSLPGHAGRILSLAFTPDRCVLASGGDDAIGRVWAISGSRPGERDAVRKAGDKFHAVTFSPNSRWLALGSGSLNGLVWLLDVTEKQSQDVAVLRGARGSVDALAFSPDGKLVAGGGEDKTLRVWEPTQGYSGTPRAVLVGHGGPIRAVVFAPNGQTLATAAQDSTVRVWNLSRIRSSERACIPHPSEATAIAYSPDGSRLVAGCRDGVIRVWDLGSIKPGLRAELKGHTGAVRLVLVATDGRTLVSVGDGLQVINWDLSAGKAVCEWQVSPPATSASVAVTVDGRYLANGTAEGAVEIYRIAEKR